MPVPGPGVTGGGVCSGGGLLGSGMGVILLLGLWMQPVAPRVKAAPTKKILTKFEIFMVLKIFGKRFLTLPKQARDSFPKSD